MRLAPHILFAASICAGSSYAQELPVFDGEAGFTISGVIQEAFVVENKGNNFLCAGVLGALEPDYIIVENCRPFISSMQAFAYEMQAAVGPEEYTKLLNEMPTDIYKEIYVRSWRRFLSETGCSYTFGDVPKNWDEAEAARVKSGELSTLLATLVVEETGYMGPVSDEVVWDTMSLARVSGVDIGILIGRGEVISDTEGNTFTLVDCE